MAITKLIYSHNDIILTYNIEVFMMNKDLPLKVRHIFSELDPFIWKGIWLDILDVLLSSPSMPSIWEEIITQISLNKKKYPSIGNSQFMKWELKAFVAQAVTSVNKNYNEETFIAEFEKYFSKKGYNINRDLINEIYQIINN